MTNLIMTVRVVAAFIASTVFLASPSPVSSAIQVAWGQPNQASARDTGENLSNAKPNAPCSDDIFYRLDNKEALKCSWAGMDPYTRCRKPAYSDEGDLTDAPAVIPTEPPTKGESDTYLRPVPRVESSESPPIVADFCHVACAYLTTSKDEETKECVTDAGGVGVRLLKCSAAPDQSQGNGIWVDAGACYIPPEEIPEDNTANSTVREKYAADLFDLLTNYTHPSVLSDIGSPQFMAMTWLRTFLAPLNPLDPYLLDSYVMAVLAFQWEFVGYYYLHPQQTRVIESDGSISDEYPDFSIPKLPINSNPLPNDPINSNPLPNDPNPLPNYQNPLPNDPNPLPNGSRPQLPIGLPIANSRSGNQVNNPIESSLDYIPVGRQNRGGRRAQEKEEPVVIPRLPLYCFWPKVSCNIEGYVRDVDVGEMELRGTIPPEVGYMKHLEKLDLGRNQLTGHIPSPERARPKGTSHPYFEGLRTLILSENHLSGSLPHDVGSMKKLERMDLDHNRLTGELPASLFEMMWLKRMELDNNLLTGALPPQIGWMKELQTLSLYENRFVGALPLELGNLANLEALHIHNNHLGGCCGKTLCDNVQGKLKSLTADCGTVRCPCATECSCQCYCDADSGASCAAPIDAMPTEPKYEGSCPGWDSPHGTESPHCPSRRLTGARALRSEGGRRRLKACGDHYIPCSCGNVGPM